MFRSTWLTVFIVEYAVTSIINGFTILTFARNRDLRKRTTYLIINLTIADFFVETVSGLMHIYHTMTFERGSGFDWGKFIVMFLDNLFTACSLLNIAMLSLERLHVTLFPFRHCLMLDWVYFKAIVCIWLLAIIPASVTATFFLITPQGSKYVWASLTIAVLFTVIVLCDNCFEFEKKSPFILIWCSVIRKETNSHNVGCHYFQHTCFSSLYFGRCP